MAKSRFTKRNWFVFFGVLIFVAVLSLTAAIGLHFYVGHKFEAESLSENFEEKLRSLGADIKRVNEED